MITKVKTVVFCENFMRRSRNGVLVLLKLKIISLAFEDKKYILDFRLNMLNTLSVLLCVRNRTMWHEIEPGMKTARKSFHCAFYCAKQKF